VRKAPTINGLIRTFLRPPVYQTAYRRGYGTLYTAIYRPSAAATDLVWPNARWSQTCGNFTEGVRVVGFGAKGDDDADAQTLPNKAVAAVEQEARRFARQE
jgi:hypothetical protein